MLLTVSGAVSAVGAPPVFSSFDRRLPNPDQPYELISGTVDYGTGQFSLYDLTVEVMNPTGIFFPPPGGPMVSNFDVKFDALVSIGLGPVFATSGVGTGVARYDTPTGTNPYVFETELLALDLQSVSGFQLRESPTRQSPGITTVEDSCPMCAIAVVRPLYISSFFDVFTEISLDGGQNWLQPTAPDDAARLEQSPEPGSCLIFGIGLLVMSGCRRGVRGRAAD
jgi:hypothetical protein